MNIRDRIQEEYGDLWWEKGANGILMMSPRIGKCRLAIKCMNRYYDNPKVLLCHYDGDIKKSWMTEFDIMEYDQENVTYTTFKSLNKVIRKYDLVIVDEPQLLSKNQLKEVEKLMRINNDVLGLTGTLNKYTEKSLNQIGLFVVGEYPIKKAIEDGILCDYEIIIESTKLDDIRKINYGKKTMTEKKRWDSLSWVIDKLQREGKDTTFLRLSRVKIIHNSVGKLNLTKKIIQRYFNDRMLVFCGNIEIAESLGIPCAHSKMKDRETITKFREGEGNHLAVVKLGGVGVTYKPLNRVIINYFDSNSENLVQKICRCLSFEYDNPDKKATITIICTDEDVEKVWLKKALSVFETEKIIWKS